MESQIPVTLEMESRISGSRDPAFPPASAKSGPSKKGPLTRLLLCRTEVKAVFPFDPGLFPDAVDDRVLVELARDHISDLCFPFAAVVF